MKGAEMADVKKIAEELTKLTVLEVNELKTVLKDEYGIEPAAAAVAVAGPSGDAGAAGGAEEKADFDVELTSAGDKKIAVIKEVRALTSLGLKEAKDLVDAAPKVVLEGAKKEDADKAKEQLEAAGATVTLK
jgi:large subunit ribosomal protein L7/L12